MQNTRLKRALAIAFVGGAAAVSYAQSDRGERERDRNRNDVISLHDDATANVIPLSDWRYDELYEGWSADALLGMPVRGPQGEEIGEAKNLLIDDQGAIVALIAEVGGFGEVGDTHVAIPWAEVRRRVDAVEVPITGESLGDYGSFDNDFFSRLDEGNLEAVTEDVRTGPHVWKVTELLDDYVIIEPGEPFGYVSDLVFDDAGQLRSVVANASNLDLGIVGNYAYPWYGYEHGWRPDAGSYALPYTREQIAGLTVFDYERFKERSTG